MPKKKFLRRVSNRYLKLGKKRKKKQKWRKPRGRDNKMREKERGYPAIVSIGYRREKRKRDLIDGKKAITVKNIIDLGKIGKNQIAVIANIGKKKKIEIVKLAKSKKIELANLNVKKFLRKLERKQKKEEKKKEKPKPEKKPSKEAKK